MSDYKRSKQAAYALLDRLKSQYPDETADFFVGFLTGMIQSILYQTHGTDSFESLLKHLEFFPQKEIGEK